MLKLSNVTKSFGGLIAINNVSFEISKGETVGLIGPNGAGKTTLIHLITGVYKPDLGSIKFNGKELTKMPPHRICREGIARTYQIPQPFPDMTALNNVVVAVLNRKNRKNMSLADAELEASYFLEFVGLFRKRNTLARDLSLYELRMLELARALATEPKLLLIDETMAGLNPVESLRAVDMIKMAKEHFDLTILWVEHVMKIIMSAAERIIVLHYGKKIAEGPPEHISKDEKVIEAYLGEKYA
ncbi:MAG: ABC transporter ATP-binding protein [Candidatus Korarchaeota archaeon]|nr:ABC transporter ATP-binding protein [Thermoproteota archaeon]